MTNDLDHDVCALKDWLREAWRRISDPSMTAFDRRELRNYMKEAEVALHVGFARRAAAEERRREEEKATSIDRRLEFRILQLVG
jgi:hypothetical protein